MIDKIRMSSKEGLPKKPKDVQKQKSVNEASGTSKDTQSSSAANKLSKEEKKRQKAERRVSDFVKL